MSDSKIQLNSKFRLQWEEAQQCHVLLYPEGLIKLSDTATEIITRCQQAISLKALIAELSEKFPDANGLAQDVMEFIVDAKAQEWIVDCQ